MTMNSLDGVKDYIEMTDPDAEIQEMTEDIAAFYGFEVENVL